MSRLSTLVAVVAVVVGLGAPVQASVPPPTDSATTVPGDTVAPTTVAPPTTAAASPATSAPVAQRTGAGVVDVAKDEDEGWDLRRIATIAGISIVVLAISGFVYGRVRSTRRPVTSQALATTSSSSATSSQVEETANY